MSSVPQAGSVALLLPARKLRRCSEPVFRQMFACCSVLEPGRTLLLLRGCCGAQHPAFLWVNPALSRPRGARWGGGGELLCGPRPGAQFEAFPGWLFSG